MFLTIVAIWAIVIPLLVLGVTLNVAKPCEAEGSLIVSRPVSNYDRATPSGGAVPRCALPAPRPRRTTTRRVCPAQPRGAGRRPTSA